MFKLLALVALILLSNPYFGLTEKVTRSLAEFYTENFEKNGAKVMQGVALPVKSAQEGSSKSATVEGKPVQNSASVN